jgi:AbiU2
MRLWDRDTKALRITAIANALGDRRIIDALAAASAARFNDWPGTKEAMSADLEASAGEAMALVRKYEENGERYGTFIKLKTLRDEHLAHRQLVPTPVDAGGYDAMDAEVEAFYQDMSSVIRLALHVVEKTAYSPREGAEVYADYAQFFLGQCARRTDRGPPPIRVQVFTPQSDGWHFVLDDSKERRREEQGRAMRSAEDGWKANICAAR